MASIPLPVLTAVVDAAALRERVAHGGKPTGLRLVDCRFDLADAASGARAYAAGHLPGAVFADLERDLSGPKTGRNGRHPLPSPERLLGRLRDWGIDDATQVVAYDAQGGSFAARLWWLLRRSGHEAVAVLDGGIGAWTAAGGAIETGEPSYRRGTIAQQPPLEALVLADDVLASGRLLVDARAAERFSGAQEPIDPVGGHIPGARNRFWQANLRDGRFKDPATLRDEWTQLLAGRAPGDVTAYCGSGVTACHNLLALHRAGLDGASLYAGSWSEWSADPGRPVARGEG